MYSSLNDDQMNDTSEESEHNSSVSDFKKNRLSLRHVFFKFSS